VSARVSLDSGAEIWGPQKRQAQNPWKIPHLKQTSLSLILTPLSVDVDLPAAIASSLPSRASTKPRVAKVSPSNNACSLPRHKFLLMT